MKRFVWIAIFVLLIAAPAAAQQELPAPVDRTFGVVEAFYQPDHAIELGATWDRMVFYWYDFQPSSPRQFRTGHIDESIFTEARAANREIVGIIKGTPAWASAERLPGGVPFGVELPINHPRNHWANFLRQMVAHYAPLGVRHWIIWNEPDGLASEGAVPEFLGTVEDFYHIVRTAYLTINEVDPDAHVNLPGMIYWGDRNYRREPYLSRLLRYIYNDPQAAANNYYFDGIGIHLYFTTNAVWNVFMHHLEILRDFGLGNKEIWFDEFNASPRRDPEAEIRAPLQANLQQQADYIVQASATALAAGADRLAVYRLYDNHFVVGESEPWGLIRGDGSLRPAYYAYQQVITRMNGAINIQRYHIREATLITFTFPDRTLFVMWSDTFRPGQFLINANTLEGTFDVSNAQGDFTPVPVVVEGGAPVLIVDAPGATRMEVPMVVVSGEVRMVELPGGPRTVWFRDENGEVVQIR